MLHPYRRDDLVEPLKAALLRILTPCGYLPSEVWVSVNEHPDAHNPQTRFRAKVWASPKHRTDGPAVSLQAEGNSATEAELIERTRRALSRNVRAEVARLLEVSQHALRTVAAFSAAPLTTHPDIDA